MGRHLASKRAEALKDRRIEAAFREHCSGVQIPVLKIGQVFEVGRRVLAREATDELLGRKIAAFVETIREN